jgi:divalent metal cation (Fe/Co/Zn/Cd) transporter
VDLVDQMDAAEQSGSSGSVFAGGNDRQSKIIRTSLVGVACNAILATAKLIIGSITHSAAIISDGVNSLTDVLSTVLLIVGAKFANKRPNRKHPNGYGKTE